MNWINFLHFYQPANQQKDILEAVVKQSYLPILQKISKLDDINISMNITGSLLELFERDGYTDLLDLLRTSVKEGKIELTGSCKFHALIPLIPEEEIERQIMQNQETLNRILGFEYKTKGFFPPEMAYHPKLDKIIERMGFEWIIMDEIALSHNGNFPASDRIYTLGDTGIKVFFRNRRASNLIMSAVARDTDTIKKALSKEFAEPYIVTGMDGETFGHHRIGFEKLLFDIFEDKSLGVTSVEKFLKDYPSEKNGEARGDNEKPKKPKDYPSQPCRPEPSTWASSIQDIEEGVQFLSWRDPKNVIHDQQWSFLNLVLGMVQKYPTNLENYEEVRHKMDMALASDHFWWASAKPWWSLEMIEDGAFRLLDVVLTMKNVSDEIVFTAYKHYMGIVSKAAEWQRQGVVREMAMQQNKMLRIPFKDRTFGVGGEEEGVYWAFINLMKAQEKEAARKGNFMERCNL
jgi:alpha-amylase/alpha-mannosidase (GH57 family)